MLWAKVAQRFEPPGAGLEVTVKPTRTADTLNIDGTISNKGGVLRRVPRLRVSLRDGNKAELDLKVIAPPVEHLAPGGTASFRTVFEHPSITATGVGLTFTNDDLTVAAQPVLPAAAAAPPPAPMPETTHVDGPNVAAYKAQKETVAVTPCGEPPFPSTGSPPLAERTRAKGFEAGSKLPQRFIGVWMMEDRLSPGKDERCTKRDWERRTDIPNDRIVRVDAQGEEGWEHSCQFTSVKSQEPAPH